VLVPVDAALMFGNHVTGENVRCYELIGGLWIVLVPNLFVQPEDGGLVLFFGHSFLFFQAAPHGLLLPIVTMAANYKAVKFATYDTGFPRRPLLGHS